MYSTKYYLVVLITLFSLYFSSLSLISKGLFSFPAPCQLETRFIKAIDLRGVLEACLQSEFFPQKKQLRLHGGRGKEASVAALKWRRRTNQRDKPREVGSQESQDKTFYLKGEEVEWERVMELTHHLGMNKTEHTAVLYIGETIMLEYKKLPLHHLI